MEQNIKSIDNAGLVLLWPFYLHYFQKLELMEGHKFLSIKHAQRAVHMLQYLATGSDDMGTSDRSLNRILCNIPDSILNDKPINITDEERKISDDLVGAAIDRWSILENTDEHGFRDSYIMRKGRLYTDEDKLMLDVEPRAIDVLMDHLPWSIATVRLSWMGRPIFVKWR